MTPCPHTISRAYIAGNIPARPLPRGAIDLAGFGFIADAPEETNTERAGRLNLLGWFLFGLPFWLLVMAALLHIGGHR